MSQKYVEFQEWGDRVLHLIYSHVSGCEVLTVTPSLANLSIFVILPCHSHFKKFVGMGGNTVFQIFDDFLSSGVCTSQLDLFLFEIRNAFFQNAQGIEVSDIFDLSIFNLRPQKTDVFYQSISSSYRKTLCSKLR